MTKIRHLFCRLDDKTAITIGTFCFEGSSNDPYLAEKGRYLPPNAKVANPLIDMPHSIDEVLSGVYAVIVTHTHADH